MNTKTFFTCLLILFSISTYSQYQIDIPYDFPIKPGTEEWGVLSTHEEMETVCQIPENILSQMTTKALAETCMNYPLNYDYYAYNDARKGISIVIDSFNGYAELIERNDASLELINIYVRIPVIKVMDKRKFNNESLIQIGFLELLLSNDRFFEKMTFNDLVDLKKIMKQKYLEKTAIPELYGLHNVQKTMLLGAKITEKTNKSKSSRPSDQSINRFIEEFDKSTTQVFENVSRTILE